MASKIYLAKKWILWIWRDFLCIRKRWWNFKKGRKFRISAMAERMISIRDWLYCLITILRNWPNACSSVWRFQIRQICRAKFDPFSWQINTSTAANAKNVRMCFPASGQNACTISCDISSTQETKQVLHNLTWARDHVEASYKICTEFCPVS